MQTYVCMNVRQKYRIFEKKINLFMREKKKKKQKALRKNKSKITKNERQ